MPTYFTPGAGRLAELVDGVVADAEVFGGAGGGGFGQGVVDGVRCAAGVVGAVRVLGMEASALAVGYWRRIWLAIAR